MAIINRDPSMSREELNNLQEQKRLERSREERNRVSKFYKDAVDRKFISKETRQEVYEKTKGHCGYCGELLKPRWHVDHINSLSNISYDKLSIDANNIDNLIASCPSCNHYKAQDDVEQFRMSLKDILRKQREYNKQYNIAVKYGLITEQDIDIVFYFEKELQGVKYD